MAEVWVFGRRNNAASHSTFTKKFGSGSFNSHLRWCNDDYLSISWLIGSNCHYYIYVLFGWTLSQILRWKIIGDRVIFISLLHRCMPIAAANEKTSWIVWYGILAGTFPLHSHYYSQYSPSKSMRVHRRNVLYRTNNIDREVVGSSLLSLARCSSPTAGFLPISTISSLCSSVFYYINMQRCNLEEIHVLENFTKALLIFIVTIEIIIIGWIWRIFQLLL